MRTNKVTIGDALKKMENNALKEALKETDVVTRGNLLDCYVGNVSLPIDILKMLEPKVVFPIMKFKDDDAGCLVHVSDKTIDYLEKQNPLFKLLFNAIISHDSIDNFNIEALISNSSKYMLSICDNLTTLQEKANLLRIIANEIEILSGNKKDAIVLKDYIISLADDLIRLKSESEQDAFFKNCIENLYVNLTAMVRMVNKISELGIIKFSNPISIPVIQLNGEMDDLFSLDLTKKIFIDHSLDISKINIPLDLSNVSINGNFKCIRAKAPIKLPRFINGELDCSDCYGYVLTDDFRVPDYVQVLKCERTIDGFETLLKMTFPDSLRTIIVENSFIKAVDNDENILHLAKQFLAKYPNIELISKSISLKDLIKNKEKTVVRTNVKSVQKIDAKQTSKPVVIEKTNDFLDRNELLANIKQDNRIPKISDEELKRLMIRAIKELNIPEEDRLFNGVVLKCIKKQYAVNIENTILKILIRDNTQSIKSNTKDLIQSQSESQSVKKLETAKTVNPIKIKKYIHKDVWKQILKMCNGNQALFNILNEINSLNMDITKQLKQGSVQYINEDGQITVSKTIKKEIGCCLVQSVDGSLSSDRKRIVWTFNAKDNIIVSCGCFDEHQGTSKKFNLYNLALTNAGKCQFSDGTDLVLTNLNLDDFYDVESLLKTYYTNSRIEKFLSQKKSRSL